MTLLRNSFLAISILVAVAVMGISTCLTPAFSLVTVAVCLLLATFFAARALYLRKKTKRHPRIARFCNYLCISFLLTAVLVSSSFGYFQKDILVAREYDGQTVTVKGHVDRIGYSKSFASSLDVTVKEINGQAVDLKAVVEMPFSSPLSELDKFSICGTASTINSDDAYIAADGFAMKIVVDEYDGVYFDGKSAPPWYAPFDAAAEYFGGVLDSMLSDEASALTSAMLLGDRSDLGDDTVRDFRRIGISHMLALSGLHVAVILGGLDMLLRLLGTDKTKRSILLIIASLVYLGITGFSLSAARAVIMACIVYIAYIVSDEADSLNSLFIAAFVILAMFPTALLDIGFWMSFFATLSIITVAELISPLTYKIKKKAWYVQLGVYLLSAVATTVAATVGTIAFVWLAFGETSVISVISNLIFSIPTTVILCVGAILIAVHWIPFVALVPAFVLNCTVKGFLAVASIISHWRGITVSLNYGFVKFIIIPMLAATVVMALIYLRRRWLIAMPVAAAALAFAVCLLGYNTINSDRSHVTYIKNGKSEMLTVVNTKGIAVCDMSTGGYQNFRLAYEEAAAKNGTEIEKLILTHYHQYHPNSVKRFCESYMVREIYLPEPQGENDVKWYNTITAMLEDMGVEINTYAPGDTIMLGDECTIELSEHYYLDRSVHPTYSVAVTDSGERFTYLSAAVCDSDEYNGAEASDHIVFGAHGPNIHNPPKYEKYRLAEARTVVLADEARQLSDAVGDYISAESIFLFTVILDGK